MAEFGWVGLQLKWKTLLNEISHRNLILQATYIEPYVGASTPFYSDQSNSFNELFKNEPGLIVTFGLRIGINHVKSF